MTLNQIGTIGYRQFNEEYKTYPLFAKETEELKEASERLFNNACEMFIEDIINLKLAQISEN